MTDKNGEERRVFTAEFKFKVVKEVLTTDQSISEVCKKYGIGTNVYYRWQDQFLSGAKESFKNPKEAATKAELRKIEKLEAENSRMKSVIAEVIAENIDFKKKFME